jgi:hypothetical protein
VSRKSAIHAFCKQCIYDPDAHGTWREQVALCSSGNCPLHSHRPLPHARPGESRQEIIERTREKIDRLRAAKGLPLRYAEAA